MTGTASAGGEDMLPGLRAAVDDSRARAAATRARKAAEAQPAPVDPVARVLVDLPLAHLDRPFDYLVTAAQADAARPGVRVKVRFAGQDVDGFLLERVAASDHPGRLQPLRRVVSAEPVLTPAVAALADEVARRYAGTRADVLRLAVPPRHATVEKQPSAPAPAPAQTPPVAGPEGWVGYRAGEAFLAHLAAGGSPRAVWGALPGADWPALVAEAVRATVAAGRGALVCVPDRHDVERVDAALTARLGPDQHVVLTADSGPTARYRAFLALSRGARRVVVGTRAAALAPVRGLGLAVCWDDGDDLHAEPRAPYPHVREVLALRSETEGCGLLLGGFARTPQGHRLVETGWAREIVADRDAVRARARVEVVEGADREVRRRIPSPAVELLRRAVGEGPVLVQTPRQGYVPALACERCRAPARCRVCSGPLALPAPTRPPTCRWCGAAEQGWSCSACGHHGLRAPVLGEHRTAEELGRALPGTTVRSSSGERRAEKVRPGDLVVATVGAEPPVEGGYAAVLLLDTWLTLAREDLRVEEEALRRWLGAAGLVRPGGRVMAIGDPAHPALQALVRWDPAGFAAREAEQRAAAHLPPAARLAVLSGSPGALDDALTLLAPPDPCEILGPVPAAPAEARVVLRTPLAQGPALAAALRDLQRVRAARKLEAVRVQIDPLSV